MLQAGDIKWTGTLIALGATAAVPREPVATVAAERVPVTERAVLVHSTVTQDEHSLAGRSDACR